MRRFNNKHVRNAKKVSSGQRRLNEREIFQAVLFRYRMIHRADLATSSRRAIKDRDFVADVDILVRRMLTDRDRILFRMLYVWEDRPQTIIATRSLEIPSQLDLLLTQERIETRLGAAFRDTKPHALYPLGDYFREPRREKRCQMEASRQATATASA